MILRSDYVGTAAIDSSSIAYATVHASKARTSIMGKLNATKISINVKTSAKGDSVELETLQWILE